MEPGDLIWAAFLGTWDSLPLFIFGVVLFFASFAVEYLVTKDIFATFWGTSRKAKIWIIPRIVGYVSFMLSLGLNLFRDHEGDKAFDLLVERSYNQIVVNLMAINKSSFHIDSLTFDDAEYDLFGSTAFRVLNTNFSDDLVINQEYVIRLSPENKIISISLPDPPTSPPATARASP